MTIKISNELTKWLDGFCDSDAYHVTALPGDASFRQYYRLQTQTNQWIVMHSPSLAEPVSPFVAIAKSWHAQGICVPSVVAFEEKFGFVLMTDFGDQLLQDRLTPLNVTEYYAKALKILPCIQHAHEEKTYSYPFFNEQHIRTELSYFKDWFLLKLLSLELSAAEEKLLCSVFDQLVNSCVSQPQTLIHRDYHSRNLMVLADDTLGVIDFQDAMIGPVTYDAVSVLRDCYVDWPLNIVYEWLETLFYQDTVLSNYPFEQVKDWFDKTGLQRHLKVLGIFSRLKLRDGKARYLNDMPRIVSYLLQVLSQYPELRDFERWLLARVLPRLQEILMQEGLTHSLPYRGQERSA